MTLATKNGSLIVKDGKLAENCGCCGDWYCCHGYPYWSQNGLSGCDPREYISSVSVTIETGEDWVSTTTQRFPCGGVPGHTPYSKLVTIIPMSHYAGTFALSPSGSSGTSFYQYDPDDAGSAATITARVSFTGDGRLSWAVSFIGHCYAWSKYSRSEISETKSLSDMKTEQTVIGSALNCYEAGYEIYGRSSQQAATGGVSSLCQQAFSFSSSSSSTFFDCNFGRSSDEKSGFGGGGTTPVVTESGSRQIRISVVGS